MSVSGIYVRIHPRHWESVTGALREEPGIDLHQGDPATGRLVITQDAASIESQKAGMVRIRRMRGVVTAEPVYCYLDEEE